MDSDHIQPASCGLLNWWSQIQKTTLPRGTHNATEPSTGVAEFDGDGVVSAEATGAAMAPKDKAMAVAATILAILIDIFNPSVERTTYLTDTQPSVSTYMTTNGRHGTVKFRGLRNGAVTDDMYWVGSAQK